MRKRKSINNSQFCKHGKYYREDIACPAEQSIYFANTILQKLSMKDYEYIISDSEGFGTTLERELRKRKEFREVEVFWALGREKLKTKELIRQANINSVTPIDFLGTKDFNTFKSWMKKLLILLNSQFHSGTFMNNLITHTTKAEASFFTITVNNNGIQFSSYYGDNFVNYDATNKEHDCTYTFYIPSKVSPRQYYTERQKEWKKNYKEIPFNVAFNELKNYCESWNDYEPRDIFLQKDLWLRKTKTGDYITEAAKQKCIEESRKAMQHWALMSLYLCNKEAMSVTYFLSPTIQGKYDSSMAIYWGPHGVPDRPFLYLLSMLLGMNQAPVLQARTESGIKEMTFRNAGHIMKNRLIEPRDMLRLIYNEKTKQLKTNDLDEIRDAIRYALRYTMSLYGLFQATRLWGFKNINDIVSFYNTNSDSPKDSKTKKEQFLSYGPINLIEVFQDASQYCDSIYVNKKNKKKFKVYLKLEYKLEESLIIAPEIEDICDGKCTLSKNVLSAIFYEIFLNALKCGKLPSTEKDTYISLTVTKEHIKSKEGGNISVVTFTNDYIVSGSNHESMTSYIKASNNPEKGIGMINSILTNLDCGGIWYKTKVTSGTDIGKYSVAVYLKGLI